MTRHNLRESMTDAGFYSVMVGLGETYFPAFALALGTGEIFAGLLATLPMLVGATFQLAAPWLLRRAESHQRWIVVLSTVQALAIFLLPLTALLVGSSAWAAAVVFGCVALYWGSGQSAAPAWNTWIEEVVPRRVRTKFFASRARLSQIGLLAGFVGGGLALQWGKASGLLLTTFCGIFVVAAICRFVSALALHKHQGTTVGHIRERIFGLRNLHTSRISPAAGRLVIYLLAIQTVVQISGPYFSPYMIKDLLAESELVYLNYMMLMGICFFGKIIAAPWWGRYAHATSSKQLLWTGGMAIIPISGLWIFSDYFEAWQTTLHFRLGSLALDWPITGELVYLCGVQFLSGITWAAYELAMSLMFIEAIPREDRTSLLTLYNWGNSLAMVLGGLIGAGFLYAWGNSHYTYLFLFGLSSVLRLVVLVLFSFTSRNATVLRQSIPGTP